MHFIRVLLLCSLLPIGIHAQIPKPVLPEGVGVNIHFIRGHEKDLDMIEAAGFKVIRMDFIWSQTEPTKGQYDWSAYDELTANLKKRGLGAIYILDYTHAAYEPEVNAFNGITQKPERHTASPRHPESIEAFARWAAAAAKHFRGERIIWEIYNEPNGFFWKPKPNVQEYAPLALATAQAIHEANSKATVIGPAISGFDAPFMDAFLQSGVLEWLDGVSVHPYREGHMSPETAVPEYKHLREQIERYAPKSKKGKIPIVSGEWGYSTDGKHVSLQTQADYIVRQQLCNLLHGIPLSIWYDWKNDGPDPAEREHNFGTVTHNLEPKPAYRAVQAMTRELDGFRIIRRVDAGNENDFVLLLERRGARKLAVWTLKQPHILELSLAKPAKQIIVGASQMGQRIVFTTSQTSLSIPVDASPIYVSLGKMTLKEETTSEKSRK